jgi:hypothetical protein
MKIKIKITETSLLFITALFLLCFMVSGRTIWSLEIRWSDIVHHMLVTGDYFHPILYGKSYYDKPLLSYWAIVITSMIGGGLNSLTLRLPSMIAGGIALYSIYQLGKQLLNQRSAVIAVWILLTTFYFLFWSRTASANMLNLAGTLLAIVCYSYYRHHPSWRGYILFFCILSLTALCKGLLAPAIAALVILPDFIGHQRWQQHKVVQIIIAMLPALVIYLCPFILSSYLIPIHYTGSQESGLYQVFHENIIRYFHPFDNRTPLHWAIDKGEIQTAQAILGQHHQLAVINQKDNNFGDTPLLLAAKLGRTALIAPLFAAGADPALTDTRNNRTPLHWAIREGKIQTVQAILGQLVQYHHLAPISRLINRAVKNQSNNGDQSVHNRLADSHSGFFSLASNLSDGNKHQDGEDDKQSSLKI